MKKLTLVVFTLLILTGCNTVSKETKDLLNGDFETGDLTGWIANGKAFEGDIVKDVQTYGEYQRLYYHQGDYHLLGSINSGERGTLTSSDFKISNTGFLTFLIAGGFNYNKVYIGLYDAKTDELLEKKSNNLFKDPEFTEGYVRIIWDVSNFMGKDVYLKIVDEDDSTYYDYLNVDGFKVNLTEKELMIYQTDALIRLGYAESGNKLEAINRYTDMNTWKVDMKDKFNYHVTGKIGWINDPNGFVYYKEQYHLFYQHNPKDVVWGPMHWGHVVSNDLVKWEYLPIALAPDQTYDSEGVFSGSAVEKDGHLYLIYTGNIPQRQVQAIAYSTDGISFEKYADNPILDYKSLPADASPSDFRDPKVWEHDGEYYMIVGSRQISNSYGQVLLFKSSDLKHWSYVGTPYKGSSATFSKLGKMWECPDIFELNGHEVLIMSPQEVPGHRNQNSTVYVVGNLNYKTGKLENINYEQIAEIDYGFDFYAPQTMIDNQGRRIMIAWMQTWNRTPITAALGYSGAMTLPRVLNLVNGKLIQQPISEIENYRANKVNTVLNLNQSSEKVENLKGKSNEILLTITPDSNETGVKLFKGQNEETKVYYKDGYVYLDRTNGTKGKIPAGDINNITKAKVDLKNGKIHLRIFIDQFSVEVFVNNGEQTITSTVYSSIDAAGIEFYSLGTSTIEVEGYDLIIR